VVRALGLDARYGLKLPAIEVVAAAVVSIPTIEAPGTQCTLRDR
jgi:hypothetical protein